MCPGDTIQFMRYEYNEYVKQVFKLSKVAVELGHWKGYNVLAQHQNTITNICIYATNEILHFVQNDVCVISVTNLRICNLRIVYASGFIISNLQS